MVEKKNKKEKTPQQDGVKEKDGAALVLHYLREQNRPYSAIEVSANLHNKVTKAQAAKLLKELHQRKEIEARVSGKQTVYHALQETNDEALPEAMEALQGEIDMLQEQLATLKANEKQAREELAALKEKPSLAELRQSIGRLEQEKAELMARLGQVPEEDDTQQPVSPEERAEMERKWRYWRQHASARRRMCRDLWLLCSEVIPENMTVEELWESLGLEGPCLR